MVTGILLMLFIVGLASAMALASRDRVKPLRQVELIRTFGDVPARRPSI